jgi:hypothetical protein
MDPRRQLLVRYAGGFALGVDRLDRIDAAGGLPADTAKAP